MTATMLEPPALREVFAAFPSGVVALAARVDGELVGMAASSFTSVSLDPPLVSVCVARTSRTWPQLRHAPRIGISVLGDGHEMACRQLARRDGDRFGGLALHELHAGAVAIDGAAARLECSVAREVDAGDHVLVLLQVHQLSADPAVAPLVFHRSRYRRLTG
jgi:flavin reductase (DIM6/NTAB) family NADH-FMN oxidoreductase RutF